MPARRRTGCGHGRCGTGRPATELKIVPQRSFGEVSFVSSVCMPKMDYK